MVGYGIIDKFLRLLKDALSKRVLSETLMGYPTRAKYGVLPPEF
jgi:hypothetical protein